ncbi:hypothetical protein SAMN02745883_02392 [Caminicella sporogenes DSM 14501]|uniref:Uncharacterized protein n=1 Tax=Caminicella sporogenes DSM 14501 TaxID=1121266 RepID=A0A1M6TMF1_9FIRM|nr:DUF6391 domain-containing protein [Caminicella sporogenes]RKD22349.1 hypothetical protein BET04_04765 [Caminicella sporogenes]SHK58086.1 hypothetical protein SAMN02745883_02392 [Caminicella sporogenes DSM 14501]
MPFLLLLILFFWLFPFLIIPFIIFFIIGFLFLIPYVVFFNSFLNVLTIPWQIFKIASNKQIRKNHSLEHATVNILEERYGKTLRIGGLAYSNGFSLSGPDLPSPYEVLDAAREGIYRMTKGETYLALHPRCGTSIATSTFLLSLGFIIALFFSNHLSLLNIIVVFTLANMLSKPLGLTVQKFFTTHSDVKDMTIINIYSEPTTYNFPFEIIINPNRTYFIETTSNKNRFFWLPF